MSRRTATFALIVLAAGLGLGGCQRGGYYRVSPDDARSDLAGSVIPDMAFGRVAHTAPAEVDGDAVVWSVRRGAEGFEDGGDSAKGAEVFRLIARVGPAPGGAQIVTDVAPAAGADPAVFASFLSARPGLEHMLRDVAAEEVDSRLRRRPFSVAAISGDMALVTVMLLPQIRKQIDAAAGASEGRDRETIDRAYERADHGGS